MQREPDSGRLMAALKSDIRTLGGEVDSYKAKTAGALGSAVFLLLLAAGGTYDLITHNNSIRSAIGVSYDVFEGIVIAVGVIGLALLLTGVVREIRRDRARELRLEQMEEELARHQEGSASC
jgi:hypothetical protein